MNVVTGSDAGTCFGSLMKVRKEVVSIESTWPIWTTARCPPGTKVAARFSASSTIEIWVLSKSTIQIREFSSSTPKMKPSQPSHWTGNTAQVLLKGIEIIHWLKWWNGCRLESTVIRSNVSHSQQATSMTYFDDIFYWINDGFAVAEEKDIQDQKYVQNQYWPRINDVFTGLLLYGATTQPIPLPRAPVQHLQVLFGSDSAHVHWQSPPNIPHRGTTSFMNNKKKINHFG